MTNTQDGATDAAQTIGKPDPGAGARRNYVMVLLVLIYACNVVDRNIISILAEPIKKSLALSDTQLGLLTGLAFALFYTFFGIPAGWLADRRPAHRP